MFDILRFLRLPACLLALAAFSFSTVAADDEKKADSHDAKSAAKSEHGTGSGGHGHGLDPDPSDLSHANGTDALLQAFPPAAFRFDQTVASMIVFGLVMLLLTKFAWGPISQGLDARENHISGMIATAEKNAHETEARLKELEARLAAQAEEAREAINTARKEGMQQKEKILAEAQEAVRIEKDRAAEEIQSAKNAALREIAQKSVNTAVSLATSIIRREVKAADHTAIINDALTQFQNRN